MRDNQDRIDAARRALSVPEARINPLATLAAAAFAASAAVLLAGVVVLGPGVVIQDAPSADRIL